jgi:hypothetical protein
VEAIGVGYTFLLAFGTSTIKVVVSYITGVGTYLLVFCFGNEGSAAPFAFPNFTLP